MDFRNYAIIKRELAFWDYIPGENIYFKNITKDF